MTGQEMRKKIVEFLQFMRWSNSRLTCAASLKRGRITYLLKRDSARIHPEEWESISRVIDAKTPSGIEAPVPPAQGTISVREGLLLALVDYSTRTKSEEIRRRCAELAREVSKDALDKQY
jgi:hypothetical protein